MASVLVVEFLCNLHRNAFKADRHICRPFGRWFPEIVESCRPRAANLAGRLGTRSKDVIQFLTFSLVGVAVTPSNVTFTEADNLIWALAAHIEKKGSETDGRYWMEMEAL